MLSHVAVCIATYQRPAWLARLLDAILSQDLPPRVRLDVVVADNDAGASAEQTVRRYAGNDAWRVSYVVEPRRGIPFARNAGVRVALASGAQALVFIDDDETPTRNWLAELLHAQHQTNADVVMGPVIPEHEDGIPSWIVEGRFFDRPRAAEGAAITHASTNNTLVLRSVFERIGVFDERFRLNGGDDTHFFFRARLAGFDLRFTNTAVVYETIPATRGRVGWLVRRSFRLGNSYAWCERTLLPSRSWLVMRPAKMIVKIATGCVRLIASAVAGRAVAVRGLQDIARAAGACSALLGFQYQEYKAIHGR